MASAFDKQIGNRNFLSPVGFKFTLARFPKIDFFSTSANLPEISLALATQPSYLKDISIPGEKITYGDFRLRFNIDEDMENYIAVHNWITSLGFPETTEQYKDFITDSENIRDPKRAFSDGTLRILNSNFKSNTLIKFKDLFPTSLSGLDFEATQTDIQYFTAEATFKYTIYNILDNN
jgi:hypothetical protein